MHILWLDTETTDIDPHTGAISQIAAISEIGDHFKANLTPFAGAKISEAALKVQGITREELFSKGEPQEEVFRSLIRFCSVTTTDQIMLAGYNAAFDKNFIFESLIRLGYRPTQFFSPYVLDVYALAQIFFSDLDKKPARMRLSFVCKWFGIPLEAHDALADIVATQTLYLKLRELWASRFCPCQKKA